MCQTKDSERQAWALHPFDPTDADLVTRHEQIIRALTESPAIKPSNPYVIVNRGTGTAADYNLYTRRVSACLRIPQPSILDLLSPNLLVLAYLVVPCSSSDFALHQRLHWDEAARRP